MATDDQHQQETPEAERIRADVRLRVDAEIRKRVAAVDTRGCTIGCLVLLALIVAMIILMVLGSRHAIDQPVPGGRGIRSSGVPALAGATGRSYASLSDDRSQTTIMRHRLSVHPENG